MGRYKTGQSNILHNMLKRMSLCLLEIVASVERIEPGVEEELGPIAGA